jgi:hypothetical protein
LARQFTPWLPCPLVIKYRVHALFFIFQKSPEIIEDHRRSSKIIEDHGVRGVVGWMPTRLAPAGPPVECLKVL